MPSLGVSATGSTRNATINPQALGDEEAPVTAFEDDPNGREPLAPTNVKILTLRYDDRRGCGRDLPAGTRAGWNRAAKAAVCVDCVAIAASASELRPDELDEVRGQDMARGAGSDTVRIDAGVFGTSVLTVPDSLRRILRRTRTTAGDASRVRSARIRAISSP